MKRYATIAIISGLGLGIIYYFLTIFLSIFLGFVVVIAIDWISVKIRDKYIVKSQHGMTVTTK